MGTHMGREPTRRTPRASEWSLEDANETEGPDPERLLSKDETFISNLRSHKTRCKNTRCTTAIK